MTYIKVCLLGHTSPNPSGVACSKVGKRLACSRVNLDHVTVTYKHLVFTWLGCLVNCAISCLVLAYYTYAHGHSLQFVHNSWSICMGALKLDVGLLPNVHTYLCIHVQSSVFPIHKYVCTLGKRPTSSFNTPIQIDHELCTNWRLWPRV